MQPKHISVLYIISFLLLSSTCYAKVVFEQEPSVQDPNMYAYNDGYYSDPYDNMDYAYSEPSRYNYRYDDDYRPNRSYHRSYQNKKYYTSRHHKKRTRSYSLPGHIAARGQKVIIVDPVAHAWGAYSSDGTLQRSGLASAGAKWCSDIRRPCRTRSGSFRINSLGSSGCKSTRYPLGKGGAPMPYCMYFNGNQGIHGSYQVAPANISHGCVRISVSDAKWLRFNFANIGTKLIVKPY